MTDLTPSDGPRRGLVVTIFLVLFASGTAGLINQVVWQRAMKLYLGGSETISSLVVVLVFMLGLGAGSLVTGVRARSTRNPARALGYVELGLVAVNLTIAWILSLDFSESVYAFQRAALSVGIPIRLLYALTALVLLAIPCFLMGMTMPLASEACQRQCGAKQSKVLDYLFVANTGGAVLGALLSGLVLLPYLGQLNALSIAVGFHAVATLFMLLAPFRTRQAENGDDTEHASVLRELGSMFRGKILREEYTGFFLGFLSLGYEILLFRLVALAYEPRPYTFAYVICLFLALWTLGVWLGSRGKARIRLHLAIAAVFMFVIPWFHGWNRIPLFDAERIASMQTTGLLYFVPCISFGILFGQVMTSFASNWGRDVGRYAGLNTLGSCLGICAMTLLGFALHYDHAAWLLGCGFLGVLLYWTPAANRVLRPVALVGVVAACVWFAYDGLQQPHRIYVADPKLEEDKRDRLVYSGRDGVVEIDEYGAVIWDGLFHSRLSKDGSHVNSNNWWLAFAPAFVHPGPIEDVCVVGLGIGVTATTLAKLESVEQVDAYEINDTLASILESYPEGTLHVLDNPKINIYWQDGRSGLALREKKYDIITQQPLYLKQAGSSILFSREYMEIVKKRLKPGGIYAIYCNAIGRHHQALVVRQTVTEVFPYYMSYSNGYCLIASNEPFDPDFMAKAFKRLTESDDPLWVEARNAKLSWNIDGPGVLRWDAPISITDDHPIVEYPDAVERLLEGVPTRNE